jgi:hypothetical protein
VAVAFALLTLVASSPARAEDAAKGAALADAAMARARQRELRVAIDLYDEAYAAAPRREYLRQIGALYDTLAYAGDSRDVRLAILYFERYLAHDPGDPPADHDEVAKRLERLRGWKARMRAEPMIPAPRPVTVQLHAYKEGDSYEVALGEGSCTTPCAVDVLPGPTLLKTRDGKVDVPVLIPPQPALIRVQSPDNSYVVAGAVMIPVGFVVGASMWALALTCNGNGNDNGCLIGNLVAWPLLGAATLITGIVFVAQGKTPPPNDANHPSPLARRNAPQFRLTAAAAAPLPGGGAAASLQFQF